MKILLLTDRMEAGGAETHVMQLALDLRVLGHEVLLWSSGGTLANRLAQRGVRCICVGTPSRSPLSLLQKRMRLRRLVKQEKPCVLHAHTRLTAQLIRGFRRRGCAEIVTAHAKFKNSPFLSRLSYWGQLTIAVGEDLRAYLTSAYRVPTESVRVIPNGVDLCRFFSCRRSKDNLRILFASRLDEDCALGAELLCKIAPRLCKRFTSVSISIAGGGGASNRISRLAKRANDEIGRSAVRLLGWVDDMPTVLREHSVFVGVSRAAIEAAAVGCAVILCGNEGYLGIWDKERSMHATLSNFCARGEPPATEQRLFCDLSTLLSKSDERQRIANEAQAYVLANLDSQLIAQQTLQVYREALPPAPKAHVLIGGYFGCGNLGDDAILQGMLFELRASHPTLAATVLSGSVRADRRRLRIKTIPRKHPLRVARAMLRADLFLLGGGSLLQNRTGNLSLLYYLSLLRLAQLTKRPSRLFACGIGPLLGSRAMRHTKKTLRTVQSISLRDVASKQLLQSELSLQKRLSVGADAALLLPPPDPMRILFLQTTLLHSCRKPLLGVVLRTPNKTLSSRFDCLVSDLRAFCRTQGMRPLFVVFDRKHDKEITQRVCASCPDLGATLVAPASPADALAWLALCRVTLSMRLHGVILSAHVGTPCIGITTDELDSKIPAFASAVGQTVLSLQSLDSGVLTHALPTAMESSRTELRARSRELQKKARKDLANALQIVYNNR